jgi:hypothetical protein
MLTGKITDVTFYDGAPIGMTIEIDNGECFGVKNVADFNNGAYGQSVEIKIVEEGK